MTLSHSFTYVSNDRKNCENRPFSSLGYAYFLLTDPHTFGMVGKVTALSLFSFNIRLGRNSSRKHTKAIPSFSQWAACSQLGFPVRAL